MIQNYVPYVSKMIVLSIGSWTLLVCKPISRGCICAPLSDQETEHDTTRTESPTKFKVVAMYSGYDAHVSTLEHEHTGTYSS